MFHMSGTCLRCDHKTLHQAAERIFHGEKLTMHTHDGWDVSVSMLIARVRSRGGGRYRRGRGAGGDARSGDARSGDGKGCGEEEGRSHGPSDTKLEIVGRQGRTGHLQRRGAGGEAGSGGGRCQRWARRQTPAARNHSPTPPRQAALRNPCHPDCQLYHVRPRTCRAVGTCSLRSCKLQGSGAV